MLAAIVNIPDPGGPVGLGMMELVDIADAPYPWVSLAVTVGAAAMAGLLLAPLDIVRTK
jgi:fusion and transport protein UGO1